MGLNDRLRFDELAEDYLADYFVNGRRTIEKAKRCVRHLSEEFGGMKASEIGTARVNRYIRTRLDEGRANATINRELAALKRMFSLAARCTPPKVAQVPHIPMLKERNVRKGFFEHEDFLAFRDTLPDYLKPIVTFAYHTGWRSSEILELNWKQVDLKEGVVRLEPGETKNEQARMVYMEPELLAVMKEQLGRRRLDCPYVFHRKGNRIVDFRYAWKSACEKTGLSGMLFHDFRRTAVRNMIRAGIPERVAMTISGHKTRSVFDRYNIVSKNDLKEAAAKKEAFLELLDRRAQTGTISGTVAEIGVIGRGNGKAQVVDFNGCLGRESNPHEADPEGF